ncbi:MAG TPA: hypothetical protein ENJ19_10655 [Gammaproteobacteria bacterium]|nr:hypothetical protein [Gammaproteobacteria bacterium]
MDQQHNNDEDAPKPSVPAQDTHKPFDPSRRRLAKAGAVCVPLLMTLANRPAWAHHCSLSQWQSGNMSQHNHLCTLGKSPGYWKTKDTWPSPLDAGSCSKTGSSYTCTGGTLFHDLTYGFGGTEHVGYSMRFVMLERNNNTFGPGNHVVAALLNAYEYPGDYVLTVANVHALYNEYLNGFMTSSELRSFLDTTWT